MSHFVLRTEDMDAARRVEEFEAACTQICHLQITPAGEEYSSRTSIALVGNAVLADTTHSSCVTQRTPALATATGDNILLHVPLSGGFSIRQRGGGEQDCGPGSIYLDPTEQPGIARFDGLHTNAFYLSLPRAALGPAADKLSLRSQIALTPQWRLMLAYAQAVHKEAALLPPADLDLSAVHLQDLALLAIGADRDAEAIARGRGARVARLRAIKADIERNLTDPGLSPRWISMRHGISPRYLRSLFSDEGTLHRSCGVAPPDVGAPAAERPGPVRRAGRPDRRGGRVRRPVVVQRAVPPALRPDALAGTGARDGPPGLTRRFRITRIRCRQPQDAARGFRHYRPRLRALRRAS